MKTPEVDDDIQVQTRVSSSVRKKLEKAAEEEDRSISSYVRRVLEQHAKGIK